MPLLNSVICPGYWNHSVLVRACRASPESADPVRLARVPWTVTVQFGPAVVGVIPVMEMASGAPAAADGR